MKEEDYLQINSIQHYAFCPRQWALMENEDQWMENVHTIEGHIIHERAHDNKLKESRGNVIIYRSLDIVNHKLGLVGKTDVVEFRKDSEGINLFGKEGKYLPHIIEYKKGKPKTNNADKLQLAAQVICLEEMLCCKIPKAYIFYWEIRERIEVDITDNLTAELIKKIEEMHLLRSRKHTPIVKMQSRCNSCSLKLVCVPGLTKLESASKYVNRRINE